MRHLDLFSGIGGFALAARWVGWETVGFCEIEPYCQKVLRKNWPAVPIHKDIRDYDGQACDIITGGFPCQPYSVAGKRRGPEDDRALWPEMLRIISESTPTWVVGENVAGFVSMGLDSAIVDLEGIGYEVQSFIIPACAVDAKHRRDRVWIVAYANGTQRKGGCVPGRIQAEHPNLVGGSRWKAEPRMDRVVDGLPDRTHRLKGLGNAIVPQVAEVIFRAIDGANNDEC